MAAKVDDQIVRLHAELKSRMKQLDESIDDGLSTQRQWNNEILVISHLGRLRNLRRNDDSLLATKINQGRQDVSRLAS